jgi:rsbT co-antagonist protein RsbR
MAELSTPIIPLASDVIALPLIGHIDPQRATQLLETVLHGANSHRARIVIIDVTGVRQLDAYGAETLVRAAQGLRLLGATTVLTGLRPAIAQTLVQLGVDFGSLLTRSSFQDGILFALGTRAADGPRRPAR